MLQIYKARFAFLDDAQQSKSPQSSRSSDEEADGALASLSRRQQKLEAKRKLQLERRGPARAAERARRKERKQEMRAAGLGEALQRAPIRTMAESSCPFSVVVDMAYETLMNERLIRKTLIQLNHAYGTNRRSINPLQYHIAHLDGQTKSVRAAFFSSRISKFCPLQLFDALGEFDRRVRSARSSCHKVAARAHSRNVVRMNAHNWLALSRWREHRLFAAAK